MKSTIAFFASWGRAMSNNRLYELHQNAMEQFEEGHRFNWILEFDCDAMELRDLEIIEARDDAEGWRSENPPKDFYFSHAQYYRDGVKHIIDELKSKSTSNRALYSLISQADISDSGDKPIPSFLTLQCQIEGDTLHCTCCFRALEVSSFLKTNLEEIRQTLLDIYSGVPTFKSIHLVIFAFHAYKDATRSPLKRPKLDYLCQAELMQLLAEKADDPVRSMDRMLEELGRAVTSVNPNCLNSLKKLLGMKIPGFVFHKDFTARNFLAQLDKAIEVERILGDFRAKASRGDGVDAARINYQREIGRLREILNV